MFAEYTLTHLNQFESRALFGSLFYGINAITWKIQCTHKLVVFHHFAGLNILSRKRFLQFGQRHGDLYRLADNSSLNKGKLKNI